MKKYVTAFSILRMFAAVAIAATAAVCACACAAPHAISSTRTGLSLCIGETRDITPYIVFAPSATDRTLGLTADNTEIIAINGTKITAVSAGEAKLAVTCAGSGVELAVTVKHGAPAAFAVTTDGAAVQTAAKPEAITPITFTAEFAANTFPASAITWLVNDTESGAGMTFEYAPPAYGQYTVSAICNNERIDNTVAVYRPTTARGRYTGSANMSNSRTPVVFEIDERIDTRNPRSVYGWFVNGEQASTNAVFEFAPQTQGEYVVELYVNGVKREFSDGETSVKITAAPSAPTGNVVFDETDGTYIEWTGDVRAVSITAPNGVRKVFERADVRYAYLFDGNTFNASEYIQVCAETPASYTITLTADAQGAPTVFEQYEKQAQRYIDNKIFTANAFISSVNDAVEFLEDLYLTGREYCEAYIARGVTEAEIRNALTAAEQKLGITATVTFYGNILKIEIAEYVNAPTHGEKLATEQIDTVIPHIEYARSALRRSDYVFASERAPVSVEVTTSEQLLYSIMHGYRPKPVAGSAASEIYRSACSILRNTIGADYSDTEKIHAVYDWLQWSARRASAADRGSAYSFLESVFGGGGISPCATYTSVGAAKVFALLCGIEGIDCEIVAQKTSDGGAYCFNKVCVGGLYYNIDVFGGKNVSSPPTREIISHSRLFMSDAAAKRLGLQPSGGYAYDESLSYYLQKSFVDKEYADRYIADTELYEEDVYTAVCSGLSGMNTGYGGYIIPGVGSTKTVMRTSHYAEFAVDPSQSDAMIQAVAQVIIDSAADYMKENYGIKPESARINVIVTGNIIQMTVPIVQRQE